jgi:hypothetical protein
MLSAIDIAVDNITLLAIGKRQNRRIPPTDAPEPAKYFSELANICCYTMVQKVFIDIFTKIRARLSIDLVKLLLRKVRQRKISPLKLRYLYKFKKSYLTCSQLSYSSLSKAISTVSIYIQAEILTSSDNPRHNLQFNSGQIDLILDLGAPHPRLSRTATMLRASAALAAEPPRDTSPVMGCAPHNPAFTILSDLTTRKILQRNEERTEYLNKAHFLIKKSPSQRSGASCAIVSSIR